VSQQINDTLIRWLVDLNFGTNVVSPKIYRDFEPKENVQLSMADVAILVKDVGLKPTVSWVTERFDVQLEGEEGTSQIPDGPEGTSGVDTAPKGMDQAIEDEEDAFLKAQADRPGDTPIEEDIERGDVGELTGDDDLDGMIDDILGGGTGDAESQAMRAEATARNERQNPADEGLTNEKTKVVDAAKREKNLEEKARRPEGEVAELTGRTNKPMPGSEKEDPAIDKLVDEILKEKKKS